MLLSKDQQIASLESSMAALKSAHTQLQSSYQEALHRAGEREAVVVEALRAQDSLRAGMQEEREQWASRLVGEMHVVC